MGEEIIQELLRTALVCEKWDIHWFGKNLKLAPGQECNRYTSPGNSLSPTALSGATLIHERKNGTLCALFDQAQKGIAHPVNSSPGPKENELTSFGQLFFNPPQIKKASVLFSFSILLFPISISILLILHSLIPPRSLLFLQSPIILQIPRAWNLLRRRKSNEPFNKPSESGTQGQYARLPPEETVCALAALRDTSTLRSVGFILLSSPALIGAYLGQQELYLSVSFLSVTRNSIPLLSQRCSSPIIVERQWKELRWSGGGQSEGIPENQRSAWSIILDRAEAILYKKQAQPERLERTEDRCTMKQKYLPSRTYWWESPDTPIRNPHLLIGIKQKTVNLGRYTSDLKTFGHIWDY